jgi:hypothetical protein
VESRGFEPLTEEARKDTKKRRTAKWLALAVVLQKLAPVQVAAQRQRLQPSARLDQQQGACEIDERTPSREAAFAQSIRLQPSPLLRRRRK